MRVSRIYLVKIIQLVNIQYTIIEAIKQPSYCSYRIAFMPVDDYILSKINFPPNSKKYGKETFG